MVVFLSRFERLYLNAELLLLLKRFPNGIRRSAERYINDKVLSECFQKGALSVHKLLK